MEEADAHLAHHGRFEQHGQERRSDFGRKNNFDGWVEVEHYPHYSLHQSPMLNGYDGFQYIQPSSNGLPSNDHAYTPMAPPQTTPLQSNTPQPLPLLMPSHTPAWPSMLTNPPGSYQAPLPIPSAPASRRPSKIRSLQTASRKTLTDDDRRRMCEYHEANPKAKQVDIGTMFGVERSTVSKVLQRKENFLSPSDKTISQAKRQKGKTPDIDKALAVWVKAARKKGQPLSDEHIKEKALMFAKGVSLESTQKAFTSTWLAKFKQKNGLSNCDAHRRGSETSASGSEAASTPNGNSPHSTGEDPTTLESMTIEVNDNDKSDVTDNFVDFHTPDYRIANCHSSSSQSSHYSSLLQQSFTADGTSPSTPYTFSPEASCNPFLQPTHSRIPTPNPGTDNFNQRPRSITLPELGVEPSFLSQISTEPATPRYRQDAPSNIISMEAVLDDRMPRTALATTFAMPNQELHHRTSAGSMYHGSSVSPSTVPSPLSPTPDEARAAVHTLVNYFSIPQCMDQDIKLSIMELSRKVSIQSGLREPLIMDTSDYNQHVMKIE